MKKLAYTLCFSFLLVGGLTEVSAETTFRVGTGKDCTHATIQSAIDASEADGGQDSNIIITRSLNYTNQALTVRDNFILRMKGGYANCSDDKPLAGAYTRIDGAGGAKQAVISTRGYVELSIEGLEITGGDASDDKDGGGIDFASEGLLLIGKSAIHGNRAGDGGGIAIRNGKARLSLGEGGWVYDNFAKYSGGGVFCIYAKVDIRDRDGGVFNNRTHGEGGGLRLKNCPTRLSAAGPLGAGVLFGNQAYQGGGMSVTDSTVDVFTSDPNNPVRIAGNHAATEGGGMVIRDNGTVNIWDGVIDSNSANNGGAGWLNSDTRDIPEVHFYTVRSASRQPPFGAVPCASPWLCNRVTGNSARPNGRGPGEGAAFWYGYDWPLICGNLDFCPYGMFPGPDFRFVQFDHNTGDSLLRISQKRDNFGIAQCLITDNTIAGNLIETSGNVKFKLQQCTISHNQIGGAVMRSATLDLRCSIVNQPFNTIHAGTTTAQFVLVPNSAQLPSGTTVFQGVPKFVSVAFGNYRLSLGTTRFDPPSAGIDIAADCGADAMPLDLDGRTRPVDIGKVPNQFGAIDLGPFESRVETIPIEF